MLSERKFFMYSFPRHLHIDLSITALHCTGIVCLCILKHVGARQEREREPKKKKTVYVPIRTGLTCAAAIYTKYTYRQAGRRAGGRADKQASRLSVAYHQTVHGTCAWQAVYTISALLFENR